MSMKSAFMLIQETDLTWKGDMAYSLFKETEELLTDGQFQMSLRFVATKKKMARYRDMIDFLFCELVLGYRTACFRFYEGKGAPLREDPRATPEQIAQWDIFLAASLHVARAAMEQDRQLSWNIFRLTTINALRKAG